MLTTQEIEASEHIFEKFDGAACYRIREYQYDYIDT